MATLSVEQYIALSNLANSNGSENGSLKNTF